MPAYKFEDEGFGIAVEDLPRIFEPFFTTKDRERGTGLGLVAVWNAVEAHYGAVEVDSTLGSGTVFTISLPVRLGEQPSDEVTESQDVFCDWRVLVVDDEPVVRLAAKALLESFGCTVLLAENGEAAIAALDDEPEQFQLVVMDMKMPNMDGEQAFYRLLERGHQVPVVCCVLALVVTLK